MNPDVRYYECHITVEPVFDDRLELLKDVCFPFKFKVADLLMKKRPSDSEKRSQNDTFTTSRSASYQEIYDRMMLCVDAMRKHGFVVWRYKIEAVLLDVKLREEIPIQQSKGELV